MVHTKTITLPTLGTQVTIDLSKITMREWRSLFDKEQAQEVDDAIMSKILGIESILDLSFADSRFATDSAMQFALEYAQHATDTADPKA
jgi:hypothetical protein